MSEISDLMAKDPLSLTKEDVTGIVAYYRENRERYASGQKTLKEDKPKAAKVAKGSVDLSSLNIEIKL